MTALRSKQLTWLRRPPVEVALTQASVDPQRWLRWFALSRYYMALRSAVHAMISPSPTHHRVWSSTPAPGLIWAAFLTLVVAGPWLLPGYLFGTDWPGPRHFLLPTSTDNSALLRAGLAVVGWAIGGEATGKLLVLGSLFAAAALAYRALPAGGFIPRAAASTIYAVNPFVYGRLHYGQLFLLAAYAALPWALMSLRVLLVEPSLRSSLIVAAAFIVVGIFSPHMLLIAGLLATILYAAHFVGRKEWRSYLGRSGRWVVVSVAVASLASAYWLIPLITGRSYEGGVIAGTGAGALRAYAAIPDRMLGLLPNLLGLYGFWAENSGRFASMKGFVPFWPVVLAAILAIAAIGVAGAFWQRGRQLAPWVAGLLVAGAVAVVLEMGVSSSVTAGLVTWLDSHVAVYRGMRDAGKWTALLALVYSQLVGLGAAATLDWLRSRIRDLGKVEWATGVASALVLALPLFYGNGLFFGAHGEIKPSQYPAGWYQADQVLAADHNPGRTLVLPWHEYMSYSFIQNQNRVVAPPAPSFFSVPVVTSTDPEVPGIVPPDSPDQTAVSALVTAGSRGQWAKDLSALGVKYILLARELDWRSFAYLDGQPGLVKIADFDSIVLYRVSFVP